MSKDLHQPATDDSALVDARFSLRGSGFRKLWDKINWTFVAVLVIGGPQALGVYRVNVTADETQEAAVKANENVETVKKLAQEKTVPAAEDIQDIAHEFKNGFADRVAAKVVASTKPERDEQNRRIDSLRQQIEALRNFLLGAEGGASNANPTTLARPAGG
jgi:uncharacterized protein (UPF0335 family)